MPEMAFFILVTLIMIISDILIMYNAYISWLPDLHSLAF